MKRWILLFTVSFLLLNGYEAKACSYCDPNFQRRQTWREDAKLAKFVVLGSITNPRLDNDGFGSTDFKIESIIKSDPYLEKRSLLTIAKYLPVDAKNPVRFLLFCDLYNQKLDIFRGTPIKGTEITEYFKDVLKLDEKDRVKTLQFYFKHLDSTHPDIASDAFLEFAKASDADVGQVAKLLSPDKFRKLLNDPNTPAERIGLFAFLLGACGTKEDAQLLIKLINKRDERTKTALSGLLGGLIEKHPDEGWKAVLTILQDPQRTIGERLAVLGAIRFFHSYKPAESKKPILQCYFVILKDGDMADMVMEDLRRWQWWDLTPNILACYGKKSHDAPIVQRAIVRYGLCCPEKLSVEFIHNCRKQNPELVKELEEALSFEKPLSTKK